MAVELATAYVSLAPSAVGIQSAIAKELGLDKVAADAGASASKALGSSLLGGLAGTGKKLVEAVGLAALGTAAFKSATDVEDANNIIVRATGATGKALEGLEGSFQKVASGSAAPLETVASTLAEVSQRSGLTGKALEGLTSQVVTFNRTTKDAPINVADLSKALAGFNVPGTEAGKVLDKLFVTSQKTGVPLEELLQTLVSAGPVARQFGFSVETTAGLLAQLNKAGVDANSIIPGLRSAFVQFAKDGKAPADGLRETLGSMDALLKKGDTAAARSLAVQLFGARGTGLVDAAISGKLSLDSLGQTFDTTGAGILDTAKKTGTLSGALGILKNNAKLALAEFATPAIQAANDALRSALPTIRDIGAEFRSLPSAVKVGTVGVVGLAAALGPLGNAAQGIQLLAAGFGRFAGALNTARVLAGVKILEMVEMFQALTVAELAAAAAPFAIAAGIGVLAVGAVIALNKVLGITDTFTDALDAGKKSGESWGNTIVAGARASVDELAGLRDARTTLLNQGKLLHGDDAETVKKAAELKAAYDVVTGKIATVTQAHKEERAARQATTEQLASYTASVLNTGSATAAFATLTGDARKAILDLQSTVVAAAGGQIGLEQSVLNIAKAEKELADLRADPASDPSDIAAKELDLATMRLSGAEAARKLDEENQALFFTYQNNLPALDTAIARNDELARQYPDQAAGIQLENDKLRDTKRFIEDLPKTVVTSFTFDNDAAIGALNDTIAKLAQLPGGLIAQAIELGKIPITATGGIFATPQVRVFAEAGPEAVLPLSDPGRSLQILGQTGLLDGLGAPTGRSAGLFDGAHVTIGDRNIIPDLDYWTKTRMSGV